MEWVCYSLFPYPYSFFIIQTWDQIYPTPYFPTSPYISQYPNSTLAKPYRNHA